MCYEEDARMPWEIPEVMARRMNGNSNSEQATPANTCNILIVTEEKKNLSLLHDKLGQKHFFLSCHY